MAGFRFLDGMEVKRCEVCGAEVHAMRSTRRYCSDACRQRAHKRKAKRAGAGGRSPVVAITCNPKNGIFEPIEFVGEVVEGICTDLPGTEFVSNL